MLIAILLILFGGQRSFGADSAPQLSVVTPEEIRYSAIHRTVADGLPGRIITSLAQTPDGYLWCGSPSGLARYDGAKFTIFYPDQAPALDGIEVIELRCDSDGRLWIAGNKGQLVVYERGQFRRLNETDGISLAHGYDLGGICDGALWIKSRYGDYFYRYNGSRFEAVNSYRVVGSTLQSFQADASGVQWGIETQPRKLVRFTGAGREVKSLAARDGESQVRPGRFFKLEDGTLAMTSSHGIFALAGSEWVLRREFSPAIGTRGVSDGVEDWYGNIWLSVFVKGLVLSAANGRTTVVALPDSNDREFIRALLVGMEGNIWAGGDDGLYQLQHNSFQSQPGLLDETRGKPARTVVQDSGGSTWIFYTEGWARHTATGWTYTPHSHAGLIIWTGATSRDGAVFAGYNTKSELNRSFVERILPDGNSEILRSVGGNPRTIIESSDGKLWVGTDRGLWCWEGNRFAQIHLPQISGNYPVRALAEDRAGRVFAGAFRHGLFRRDATNTWQRLTTAADAGSDGIWAIHFDDEGTLWVAADSGLARWRDGHWFSYAESQSALPRLARSVICDEHDGVWIGSQFGVTRVERRELNALAAGQDVVLGSDWFDRSDGLPSVYCDEQQHALRELPDGRIWVATARGAAVLNWREWQQHRQRIGPPFVHVEAVLIDDKSHLDPGVRTGKTETAEILAQAGTRRLEFRYTAVNLTANQRSRFRYRLEGVDSEWLEAGEQRTAVYHRLRPGDYRFQVTAANKLGLWNDAGAVVAVIIQPFWWQTLWARLGFAAVILGLVWCGGAIKLRQVRRRRAHQEEFARRLIESQEAERKRIAGELHDGLGQNLLVIKSGVTMALRHLDNPEKLRNRLEELAEISTGAVKEVREISHALRPVQLDELGLTKAIAALLAKVDEAGEFRISSRVESIDGLLSPEFEISFFRVIQECLGNIQKHAHAASVEFAIRVVGEGGIHMTIADDGRGFDPAAAQEANSGMGLRSIQERVRAMGGTVSFHARAGGGTRIEFSIPGRKTTA